MSNFNLKTSRPASIAAVLGLALAASVTLAAGPSQAEPVRSPDGVRIVDSGRTIIYHGGPVCWYRHGWHGRGWYRCDYEWRSGFGWVRDQDWNGVGPGRAWYGWPRHHFHHHPRPPVAHPPGQGPAKPPAPGAPPKPGGPHPGAPHPGGPRPGQGGPR